jgi:hypothetical protein
MALTGAGGENRTHDLPLTKGLRYHYATPASVVSAAARAGEGGCYSLRNCVRKGRHDAMSTKAADREKRRAEALRQNLKRRKAAARAQAVTQPPTTGAAPAEDGPNVARKAD